MSETPDVIDAEPADPSAGGDHIEIDLTPTELAVLGREVESAYITATAADLEAEVAEQVEADLAPQVTSNAGPASQGGGGRGPGGGGQKERRRRGAGGAGGGAHFSIFGGLFQGAFSLRPSLSIASGNRAEGAIVSSGRRPAPRKR